MKVRVTIPIPMATINRMLAMHHWERKKYRDFVHFAVSELSTIETDSLTQTTLMPRQPSTSLWHLEFLQTIRPNKSRQLLIRKLKSEAKPRKRPSSKSKK